MNIPNEYLGMSDGQLYQELAGAIAGGYAAPPDSEEAERRGFNYFQSVLPQVRTAVCGNSMLTLFIEKEDAFSLASGIAEILSAHFGLPSAVATISVLAARMGVKKLCPDLCAAKKS